MRENKYTYTLAQKGAISEAALRRYHKSDLELMTTHQLREICRTQKIINGVISPMDKDDLIRVILRFRGADESLIIREQSDTGRAALEELIGRVKKQFLTDLKPECGSKIVVYKGLAVERFDRITMRYQQKLAGTNALVVSADREICAILNLTAFENDTDFLYLTKTAELECEQAPLKSYSLYCFDKAASETLYRIYSGEQTFFPEHLSVYRVPLLDFEVKEPVRLNMPLAIDFGTSNTTAGAYLDGLYFERMGEPVRQLGLKENDVNYAQFYDRRGLETALLPSAVCVLSANGDGPRYLFGYEAERLAGSSYIDEGFCVFYDIKRWVGNYEKMEEITDRQGRRAFVRRSDIIRAFLQYVIDQAKNRFKCVVDSVHISGPVKQKALFQKMFSEILPQYAVESEDMLDEGVSVLYNTISEMIKSRTLKDGMTYKALILDCGGGTTDLSSCSFRVFNRRVSYKIEIETAYENGDTDFGGNNLTYRIMQLLKIELARTFDEIPLKPLSELLEAFDIDVYRFVDEHGTGPLYEALQAEYEKAEAVIPTRFSDYEKLSRADYYRVKNNFHLLFGAAEHVKKEFYNKTSTLRVLLSGVPVHEAATTCLLVDKWKLTVRRRGKMETVKEFPRVACSVFDVNTLIKADIYGIVQRFMERMYEKDELYDYSLIKLTGQSCKIDLFRSALKEFVPGRIIKFKRMTGDFTEDFELKMTCIDGALKYLKDKKYGYADIHITRGAPALPYTITAFTHTGEEKVLIHCLDRERAGGNISRNMENLTLKLYLKDMQGRVRHSFTYSCAPGEFHETSHEEIRAQYEGKIPQGEVDCIVDKEVKFFVWARPMDWGYLVVPIFRNGDTLGIGREQFFGFENDAWVKNFFDGTK